MFINYYLLLSNYDIKIKSILIVKYNYKNYFTEISPSALY